MASSKARRERTSAGSRSRIPRGGTGRWAMCRSLKNRLQEAPKRSRELLGSFEGHGVADAGNFDVHGVVADAFGHSSSLALTGIVLAHDDQYRHLELVQPIPEGFLPAGS